MDKARVEFRGDWGTPIRYDDIVLWRDVVFLESVYHYDEENTVVWGRQPSGPSTSRVTYAKEKASIS